MLGVYPDGVFGPLTRDSLKQLQEKSGLEPTGEADAEILTLLLGTDWPKLLERDVDLSSSIANLRSSLADRPSSAWSIVESLLSTHAYGGEKSNPSVIAIPDIGGVERVFDVWLGEVRALYAPLPNGALDGRKVVAGLAMLEPAVHDQLARTSFLSKLEQEIEGFEEELSEEGRSRRASDASPTVSDRPATRDELNRTAFANLLASQIEDEYTSTGADGEADSFMIHLEGPWGSGKSTILNLLAANLAARNPSWLVAEFNAWRHQRVGRPWWLLAKVVYRAALEDKRISLWRKMWLWLDDKWWRARLAWRGVLALALGSGAIVWLASTGKLSSGDPLGILATVAGALTVLTTVALSARSLASALSVGSARGAETFIRSTRDPMNALQRRFRTLTRRVGRPVAIFIDDVDRCRSDYVVDLLEGVQTILRQASVCYVVAADRRWLYDSYREIYPSHESIESDPGRPLGHLFLEKSFQLSATVPRLTDRDRRRYLNRLVFGESGVQADTTDAFAGTRTEEELLDQLRAAGDRPELREEAVARLSTREIGRSTEHYLSRFAHLLEPNPRAIKRLLNAYRPALGLEILEGRTPPGRSEKDQFVLWLIVTLRWPLLAERLAAEPLAADYLVGPDAAPPPGLFEDEKDGAFLAHVSRDRGVQNVMRGQGLGVSLDTVALKRLLDQPGPVPEPVRSAAQ